MEKKSSSRRESSERKPAEQDDKHNDDKPVEGGPPGADPAQPAKNRRKRAGDEGGWMTSGSNQGTGGRHATLALPLEEDEPKESQAASANRDKHMQDDNDEIVLIPDLDEEGGADSDQRIAHAPRNVNRRIPTLKDLENEVKAAVPTSEEGLNLTVLLTTLVPADMTKEEDTLWTFESLLREITDELSDTPKTVISVTIPGASTAAIAENTSGANKTAAVKKPVKDTAGKAEGGGGGGATNKTKK